MNRAYRILAALFLALVFHVSIAHGDIFQYVERADPSYTWRVGEQRELPGAIQLVDLDLVSQTWMDIQWKHTVRLLIPEQAPKSCMCALLITGGNPSDQEIMYGTMVTKFTGWPMAVLYNIPNQPLFGGLHEDALISYTFAKALETGNKDWPLLFPMTKAAMRAMDAIQAFGRKGAGVDIQGFMTLGASKRGWTTWFTSVVDPRVKGIAPIVYDNLWLEAQMKHQRRVFGGYSEQIDDYSEKGLPDLLSSSQGKGLGKIVDPFSYRKKMTQPKLMIIGTNDRYWPLDALNLYYNGLPGRDRNYILYCPNEGHGIRNIARMASAIGAFARMLDGRLPFPELTWRCAESKEVIRLDCTSKPVPSSFKVWQAASQGRDFREALWTEAEVEKRGDVFVFERRKPNEGYAALFGEYGFQPEGRSFWLCTSVYVAGPDPKTCEPRILSRPWSPK